MIRAYLLRVVALLVLLAAAYLLCIEPDETEPPSEAMKGCIALCAPAPVAHYGADTDPWTGDWLCTCRMSAGGDR